MRMRMRMYLICMCTAHGYMDSHKMCVCAFVLSLQSPEASPCPHLDTRSGSQNEERSTSERRPSSSTAATCSPWTRPASRCCAGLCRRPGGLEASPDLRAKTSAANATFNMMSK